MFLCNFFYISICLNSYSLKRKADAKIRIYFGDINHIIYTLLFLDLPCIERYTKNEKYEERIKLLKTVTYSK